MGISHFFIFHQFPMLFNGKFAFCQFSILFNGNFRLKKLGGGGQTDERTYGRMEIHPCVLQDIGPLGPLPKKVLSCIHLSIFLSDNLSICYCIFLSICQSIYLSIYLLISIYLFFRFPFLFVFSHYFIRDPLSQRLIVRLNPTNQFHEICDLQ